MIDFPSSPSIGQIFTAAGCSWRWNGVKWVANTPAAVPANDIGRNLIHNPMFNVGQRGAGPFTVNGYTADRWGIVGVGGDTFNVSRSVLNDTQRSQIGDEAAAFCLQNTVTGTAAAGAGTFAYQAIEDVRRLAGKTITVSFWANTGTGLHVGVSCSQVFGTGGSPSPTVNVNGQSFTLTGTWTRYSATFTLPSVSGKVLGTNNDHSTTLYFWYSAGANFAVQAGSPGVQSGIINLWGVQLEIGSTATPLEKPDPRYDLSNCQRFYRVTQVQGGGYAVAGTVVQAQGHAPVTMRAQPTMVETSDGSSNLGTAGYAATNPGVGNVTITATAPATGQWYMNKLFSLSADL
jgi:hypothetical protein